MRRFILAFAFALMLMPPLEAFVMRNPLEYAQCYADQEVGWWVWRVIWNDLLNCW